MSKVMVQCVYCETRFDSSLRSCPKCEGGAANAKSEQWLEDQSPEIENLLATHFIPAIDFHEALDESVGYETGALLAAMNNFLREAGDKRLRVTDVKVVNDDGYAWKFIDTASCSFAELMEVLTPSEKELMRRHWLKKLD